MPKKILNIILLLFLFISTAYSQAPSIEWQYCYGGTGNQNCFSIKQTGDGGYISCGAIQAGAATNVWIVKLDALGTLDWQKSIGGNGFDRAYCIEQTADGGYIIAGYTNSNNTGDVGPNHGDYDYWIVKMNDTGGISWQKNFGGSGADYPYDIHQTTDGGYIVAGESTSTDGDITGTHGLADAWILKLDVLGNIVWQKTFGGSAVDQARSIKQSADGGYIFTGLASSSDGDLLATAGMSGGVWTVKLNASGDITWQKRYGGISLGQVGYSICLASDGGYAVSATCYIDGGDVTGNHGSTDYWVIKLDASGNLSWQKALGGSSADTPGEIIQSSDGGFVVMGWSFSSDGNITGNHAGTADYWVAKLSATGSLSWQRALGGNNGEMGYSVRETTDGGYIIGGYSNSNNTGDVGNNPNGPATNDFWIIKLAPDVVPVTLSHFDATASGQDVLCQWKTLMESNSSLYIVERSDDAYHFSSLGSVAAAGNSTLPLDYNFTDRNALLSGKDYLYYRLKMVDIDGSFKYSNTVKVRLKYSPALNIYPIPVVDQLNVSFRSSFNEPATLAIFNSVGIKVYHQSIAIIKGNNYLQVNVNDLAAGNYVLELHGGEPKSGTFIKVK